MSPRDWIWTFFEVMILLTTAMLLNHLIIQTLIRFLIKYFSFQGYKVKKAWHNHEGGMLHLLFSDASAYPSLRSISHDRPPPPPHHATLRRT